MLSWVISPLVAGAFSGIIYAITRAYVLRADPDQAIRRQRLFVALLISIILAVTIVFVCIRSPWPSEDFRLAGTILFSTMLPLAVGVVAYYWLLPRVFHNYAPSYIDVKTPLVHAEQHHPRRRERSSDTRLVIRSTSSSERFASTNSMAESAADASEMAPVENEETADLHAYADQYSGLIEANFELLQVLSASYLAFSHGAQDVSNAIGPVTAILDVYRGGSVEVDITPPIWLMALGGAGICTGLFFFGHYVMSTLGGNLTKITPSRGFSVELGTGLAVLLASFLKLPISSTHCAVGAVVAVGLLNRQGTKAVSWSLLWKVVGSWIVTLPTAGLLSAGFYAALRPVVAAVELGPAEMLLRCFGNCSALLDTYA
ncbi:uncharacterized protein MONBRDRAFT_10546 [Monosiga brevicollis MX1]|uniref:Phosphate transporter n=1 Tax=Monosiga brevicollis TaxID=81824 RepID=A9V6P3_MONBE|nr:uncharacterized protein MONBRDRAFT_10546 [Monosiga brevicollis MX1]EDQ86770.1 predicted protein [Monosiga brevicollis MX1]|eukprot:XP_001748315.1 hypothetical protein [Monosiga brevicollis MX1]